MAIWLKISLASNPVSSNFMLKITYLLASFTLFLSPEYWFFFRQLFYEGLPQAQFLNLLSNDAYSLSDLIHYHSFKHHLHTDDFQIYISSPYPPWTPHFNVSLLKLYLSKSLTGSSNLTCTKLLPPTPAKKALNLPEFSPSLWQYCPSCGPGLGTKTPTSALFLF